MYSHPRELQRAKSVTSPNLGEGKIARSYPFVYAFDKSSLKPAAVPSDWCERNEVTVCLKSPEYLVCCVQRSRLLQISRIYTSDKGLSSYLKFRMLSGCLAVPSTVI
ncbi:hypothetical protein RRG08_050694 [Elysia crispata]|uniref:Uncharacterized protein n=1 Tax=Elysia crispata TaxID=231223 RepID=A0AAE1A3L8_9GAST|nr:hypothetical protein RRG08_050694 [Elysia crispata]